MVLMIIKVILPTGNKNIKIWALLDCGALFFIKYRIMTKDNNEDLRPSKMRGVVFPKAKYGVILAITIIILVNLIYYKDEILNFFNT